MLSTGVFSRAEVFVQISWVILQIVIQIYPLFEYNLQCDNIFRISHLYLIGIESQFVIYKKCFNLWPFLI